MSDDLIVGRISFCPSAVRSPEEESPIATLAKALIAARDEMAALKRERDAIAKELRCVTIIKGSSSNPGDEWTRGFADACNAVTENAKDALARLESGAFR